MSLFIVFVCNLVVFVDFTKAFDSHSQRKDETNPTSVPPT